MKGDDDEDEDSGAIGASRYPCMPSLVALQQMRNRLQLAHLGRKLMKWTALATGKEMRRLAMELDEASKSFHDDCQNAFILLARGRYCFPSMNTFVLESVPHHPRTAHVKVATTVRTVTAVKCKIYSLVKLNADPYEILMVSRGGEQCLKARTAWFELLVAMISLLQLRSCYLVAEAAHHQATKKSKVLGKVVIPKINETIAYILSEMEEHAREEFYRMKKILEVKTKHRKKAEKKELKGPPVEVPKKPEEIPPFLCPHTCVRPEQPLVIEEKSSSEEEEQVPDFIPEEPIAEPEPCGGWGNLPSTQIGGKPIIVPKTPIETTPKASKRSQPPCSSAVSLTRSVRIILPDGEEKVQRISTYQTETPSNTVSRTTTRSIPEVPSQPFPRAIQGPVCKVCKSCRPRPQCKHKVFDGKDCKLCQLCCKTSSVLTAEESEQEEDYLEVIILGDGYDEAQFGLEEKELGVAEVAKPTCKESKKLQYEDAVSINTIGTIGDLSLEDNEMETPATSESYTSDPIYKLETTQTTNVKTITKTDGTVIQQRVVTTVIMETVPEDNIERSKSREITQQIAELQKFLCKSCFKNESPNVSDDTKYPRDHSNIEPAMQFEKVCDCAECSEAENEETICLCKKKSSPCPDEPAKCSYEWSCGGAVPECSLRKKNKKVDDDVNSHEQKDEQ